MSRPRFWGYNKFVNDRDTQERSALNTEISQTIRKEIFGTDPAMWAGVDEALKLRSRIGEIDISQATFLDKMRDEILSDRLTDDEVWQVRQIERSLINNPKLKEEVVAVLLKTQEELATALGVKNQVSNLDHVRDVLELCKSQGPLVQIGAVLHDYVKLASIDGKDTTLLAEHEILSAVAAGKIGAVIQRELGISGNGLSKYLGFLASHGEDEYPYNKAVSAKSEDKHIEDGRLVRAKLFGGMYVKFPGLNSGELRMFEESDDPALVDWMKSISCADKLSGEKLISFQKYLGFYKSRELFENDTLADFVLDKLLASYIANFDKAPNCELKRDFWNSNDFLRSILLISLLREKMGHEVVDEVLSVDSIIARTNPKVMEERDVLREEYEKGKMDANDESKSDFQITFGALAEEIGVVNVDGDELRDRLMKIRDDIFKDYAEYVNLDI